MEKPLATGRRSISFPHVNRLYGSRILSSNRGIMTTVALSPADQALSELVSAANPCTIDEVLVVMHAIDSLLPVQDGLKWFNRLYTMVTEQVDMNPPGGAWKNPVWLTSLDVVFARYYLGALRGYFAGTGLPSAWKAFFDLRMEPGIDRIQFAVAGMNAHINRDLPLALIDTCTDLDVLPAKDGPEYADYDSINDLLSGVMPPALAMLATDPLGEIAQDTGKAGRILAFWNLCRARELAWDFADHLRTVPQPFRPAALAGQDALAGALSRAILLALQ